jgi:enhancer of mRNA-decapping protein 3
MRLGEITLVESAPLLIQSHFILSLGAPKTGLWNALVNETPGSPNWQLFVADIGIPNVAWKKYGSRRRQGVDFGSGWVVGLRFVNSSLSGA